MWPQHAIGVPRLQQQAEAACMHACARRAVAAIHAHTHTSPLLQPRVCSRQADCSEAALQRAPACLHYSSSCIIVPQDEPHPQPPAQLRGLPLPAWKQPAWRCGVEAQCKCRGTPSVCGAGRVCCCNGLRYRGFVQPYLFFHFARLAGAAASWQQLACAAANTQSDHRTEGWVGGRLYDLS